MGMRYVGSKGTLLAKDALIVGIVFAPFTCGLSMLLAAIYCAHEEQQENTYYTKPHRSK